MEKGILIVDDSAFMRRIIRETLEEKGLTEFFEAKDGDDAVRQFKKNKPAVVLLDITLPGKTGMEVLTEIMDREPGTKVIMCSSIGQEETIRQARQKGAADFVVKPFQREKLAETVLKYTE